MKTKTPNPILKEPIDRKGQTALAREMGVTLNTVRAWIERGYVPARQLAKFCNALDIELAEGLNLASKPDEVPQSAKTLAKPPETLATLVEVKRGHLTLEEAVQRLGLPIASLKIAYSQNEHRLFELYSTLTEFSEGRIGIKEATERLNMSRTNVYYLMRVYGVPKPEREVKPRPVGRYKKVQPTYEKLALDVIAGRTNAKKAAENTGMAQRTLHRYIEKMISPRGLNELAHWPHSFRLALAHEIEHGQPKIVEKWVDFAQKHGLILEKRVRRLPEVRNWREVDIRRTLIAVLQGEATLDEIVVMRRGAKKPLESAFDGICKGHGLRYAEVASLPVVHQMAFADLLVIEGSHYRRAA